MDLFIRLHVETLATNPFSSLVSYNHCPTSAYFNILRQLLNLSLLVIPATGSDSSKDSKTLTSTNPKVQLRVPYESTYVVPVPQETLVKPTKMVLVKVISVLHRNIYSTSIKLTIGVNGSN
ncbi:hypothetical protein QVD17_38161 [Tagetes erecta]|uniref:Uncharacterized protein n=1 Tax=Tagetes erecta TaxID=13708 RepID=A0AAD8JY52_TARER|nr:hypothetical protein QVD17_38161 [Tagetes erecta]